MLLLGHTGITLGAAALLAGIVNNRPSAPVGKVSWFTSLSSYVDIRILLIGSLLPDIIDKPLGHLLFRETISQGRIFSHTLLFLVMITAVGFYLYKSRRKVWLLTLAFGSFTHFILDQMWLAPKTLFWPFLGLAFEKADLTNWVTNLFQSLMVYPEVYVPEAVGIAVLLWFGLVLLIRKKVNVFLKYGKAD